MESMSESLPDAKDRRTAITDVSRSYLVEAGAGTGKTAVMAGRVAMLLAEGVPPHSIIAVTFTKLAASELLARIREYVVALTDGEVPGPLEFALPTGISEVQKSNLAATINTDSLNEITCSTIHGFCERLIEQFPAEAMIDPGATVMDEAQEGDVFEELKAEWLREILTEDTDEMLTALVLRDAEGTLALIKRVLDQCRKHRTIYHDDSKANPEPEITEFRAAVEDFVAFLKESGVKDSDLVQDGKDCQELADFLESRRSLQQPVHVVEALAGPHSRIFIASGAFKAYKKEGKWNAAAKAKGIEKEDKEKKAGYFLHEEAKEHYNLCHEAWQVALHSLKESAASRILSHLISLVQPVLGRFSEIKRSMGLLDFNDLIYATRDLLRDNIEVRDALAQQFTHVLVDEFQDTDPIQTEIFWRLCGTPEESVKDSDWANFTIRPGALFLVADPKQAIYRFRGADINAYLKARRSFLKQRNKKISITTNFRSCPQILEYVNACFVEPFSEKNNQPGFQALEPSRPERARGKSVVALQVALDPEEKPNIAYIRSCEAEAVANLCTHLIGREHIYDLKDKNQRKCRAGDIALLAPVGSELSIYQKALEDHGIPIVSMAGKQLFFRQEIKDLIALTCTLADYRDTLALGSLLRGPLVGLSEEELLDISWSLRETDDSDSLPKLNLNTRLDAIEHEYARDILSKLSILHKQRHEKTPYALLSQAVDLLHIRPLLQQRYGSYVDQALANVERFLGFSRAYDTRGIRSFADSMKANWKKDVEEAEARPDSERDTVSLITIHSAKGLEWPIVMPINTMSELREPHKEILDRTEDLYYDKVFGLEPNGYDEAKEKEIEELNRERVRLLYVALTRAQELLFMPRFNIEPQGWLAHVELNLSELKTLKISSGQIEVGRESTSVTNQQTKRIFDIEQNKLGNNKLQIKRQRPPSKSDRSDEPETDEDDSIALTVLEDESTAEAGEKSKVQGGKWRGDILHKLIEEVLTGETAENKTDLADRARELTLSLDLKMAQDPSEGLVSGELADSVIRALSLPEISVLRPALRAELPLHYSRQTDEGEEVTSGIADAIAFSPEGKPEAVVDWKSDVNPKPNDEKKHRAQVKQYLKMSGIKHGLVVYATSGRVLSVEL